ncbi:multisite-specific tRNA:(cytosine-C(5))-methyltransferase [Malassezia brasiliensis]|uniref:Multisite-specific tRNA:(Cytosine-C(5))-methyltransferase n=1 Tax=Malassezia brasiliensis TaxID=1821822 RepID=A0AAF0INX3_9BASI|nr:multisite-specific tRNA:(cytosine-C(5))-methyltransferase [Malassezia brasiliensis]
MARGKHRGRGRGGRQGGGRSEGERHGAYSIIDQKNPKFEAYYLGQGILPHEEWDAFLEAMRTALPTTFRITSGKPTSRQLLDAMHDIYLPFLSNVEFEGEKVAPPRQLEWYPEGLGWHLDVRKNVLRKSPEFKRFQQFLVHETDVGSISRQEAVSMLPPLFLDVRPEHLVLDMCAAPGSKTAQLIEAIHSPVTSKPDAFDPLPLGVVVANDSDTKRAHMLVHQAQRLPSPNLCVTNVDASSYPNVNVAWKGPNASDKVVQRELKYDRILADVPCSGDGTLRKNIAIWKDWTTGNGVGLHALQTRILIRGLQLLRPGGRLVYSTCSLNPVENEAVVGAALRHFKGEVELVDCSDLLPALKRRPGMTSWKVAPGRGAHLFAKQEGETGPTEEKPAEKSAQGEATEAASGDAQADAATPPKLPRIPWVESWDVLQTLDADLAARLPRSLWPQGDEAALQLERCVRVYPHMQNTGGFFVACLVKKETTPDDSESLAEGMVRAMQVLDQERSTASVVAEATAESGAKRGIEEPSTGVDEEPAAKRARSDGPDKTDGPAEGTKASDETSAANDAALPAADKHEEDRKMAQKKRTQPEGVAIGPGGMPYREDPFAYVNPQNAEVQSCVEWFGLHDFPVGNLLVRNAEQVPLRSIYLTSSSVRAIVAGGGAGVGVHPTMNPIRLRLLNCGVKVFGRQESVSKVNQAALQAGDVDTDARRESLSTSLTCRWRVVSDSLHSMRPFLSDKVVIRTSLSDLAFFIKNYYPVLDSVPGDVGARVRESAMGSYVLDIEPSEYENHKLTVPLSYPIWRSIASVNLMLDKQEKSALSFRLFDTDLSDPEGQRQFSANPRNRNNKKNAAEQAAEDRAVLNAESTETTTEPTEPVKAAEPSESAADS